MADLRGTLERAAGAVARHRGLILPAGAAGLIFVILVPLPPVLVDVLLAANIALAAIILLTTIYVSSPLEFSVFPSLLLAATLFRLVLNVATTRLILTCGAEGRSLAEAHFAAGKVIWAFSRFVTSGSLAVGVILFCIIAVVQFVVITKGASRISEVAARFVLDAMPGKQMAIDADLGSKLIDEREARRRRERIAREADFYGAMDGASKFLRGDAVASVIITLVNIVGGLYVGVAVYGWNLHRTTDLFTRLTIGDGLVTQVPALIVAISAALLVTRSAARANLGEEFVSQLTGKPVALLITAVFLAALALTSLPKAPLLLLGVGCGGLGWMLSRRQRGTADEPAAEEADAPAQRGEQEEDLDELLRVEPVGLELGFSLIRLVEPSQGGDLLDRIAALRRQLARELGLLLPTVRVADNLRLDAHGYTIRIRGAKVAEGLLYPGQLLAVAGPETHPGAALRGRQTEDPTFHAPAAWIGPDQQEHAERLGYTVVEAPNVLMTHLGETLRRHAAELLSREQVGRLLEHLRKRCENLVDEVTSVLRTGQIQKVLQNLLRERVPVRDLETILEALVEAARETDDPDKLTEAVRPVLARTLSQQYCDERSRLWCVCLSDELAEAMRPHVEGDDGPPVLPADVSQRVVDRVSRELEALARKGRPPVVLCAPQLRRTLHRVLTPAAPDAAVLGYDEVDSVEVQSVNTAEVQE
jgi:flagellar biosynthesis protein FlhA